MVGIPRLVSGSLSSDWPVGKSGLGERVWWAGPVTCHPPGMGEEQFCHKAFQFVLPGHCKTGCNVSTDSRWGWELAVWAKGRGKHVRILPNVCFCDGIMGDFKYFPVMSACYFYNEKMEISWGNGNCGGGNVGDDLNEEGLLQTGTQVAARWDLVCVCGCGLDGSMRTWKLVGMGQSDSLRHILHRWCPA